MGNSNAHSRLNQVIEYLKDNGVIHKQQDIADRMELPRSTVSNAMHGRARLSFENFLRRFAHAYPRISVDWLLTGEGAMVLPDTHTQRPHYNGHVAAGAWDIEPQPVITDTWRDILDIAPEYDFTATATGDSMLPLIHDGDTLYCRRLYRGDPLCPRSVYLFATPSGTLVKQLYSHTDSAAADERPTDDRTTASDKQTAARTPYTDDIDTQYNNNIDTLTLRSLNPAYSDIDVPLSDILGIAKVVATFHPLGSDLPAAAPGLRPLRPDKKPDQTPNKIPDQTPNLNTNKKSNKSPNKNPTPDTPE